MISLTQLVLVMPQQLNTFYAVTTDTSTNSALVCFMKKDGSPCVSVDEVMKSRLQAKLEKALVEKK